MKTAAPSSFVEGIRPQFGGGWSIWPVTLLEFISTIQHTGRLERQRSHLVQKLFRCPSALRKLTSDLIRASSLGHMYSVCGWAES